MATRGRCAGSSIGSSCRTRFCCGATADDAGLAGLAGKGLVQGCPAAYVCAGFVCKAPVTTPLDLVGGAQNGEDRAAGDARRPASI